MEVFQHSYGYQFLRSLINLDSKKIILFLMIILFHGAGGHGVVNGKIETKINIFKSKKNKNNLIFNFFKKKSKRKKNIWSADYILYNFFK